MGRSGIAADKLLSVRVRADDPTLIFSLANTRHSDLYYSRIKRQR